MGDSKVLLISNRNYHDINPRDGGYEACKPDHSYGPAIRDYLLLHYVLSGTGIFRKGNREYILKENQCFVIRPYETTYYQADCNDPWRYIWIGFNSGIALPAVLTESDVFYALKCKHIFLSVMQINEDQTQPELYLCSLIWELLALLFSTEKSGQENKNALIDKAKNYMENEFMNDISVESIAGMLYLDRTYFSKSFRKHTGFSPQSYLCNYRLEKAAALLAERKYTAAQAAQMTGYRDYCNFSKMFRKKFGVPPGKYADSGRNT